MTVRVAPDRLDKRMISARERVGATATIRQHSDLEFVRLAIDQPLLIAVRAGTKTLRRAEQRWVVVAGGFILIPGGQTWDIGNRPAEDGAYEASWLAWDDELLGELGARPHQARAAPDAFGFQPEDGGGFWTVFDRARSAIAEETNLPEPIARHRMREVLLWVEHYGGRVASCEHSTVAAAVRRLVGQAPEADWQAQRIARELAMSEATLRRRLAAEQANLTEILVDLRMSFGLQLLQSTDRSVSDIASQAGYESASRFAVRFRQRFGFPPTAVRGHRRDGAAHGPIEAPVLAEEA